MTTGARRPTLAQVAQAAGVSVMTASYTYSRPSRVSSETAAKVLAAAAQLGYAGPHPGARGLRRGRAGSLGVVMAQHLGYAFEDPAASLFLSGVAEVCTAAEVGLTLVPTTGGAGDVDRVADASVDGFVVWGAAEGDQVVDAVLATGLPASISNGPPHPGFAPVGIDDREAARAMARITFAEARRGAILSLARDRRRQTALLDGHVDPATFSFPVARHRLEGFLDAWRELGGDMSALAVAACSQNRSSVGQHLMELLLTSGKPPDAVVAMSDALATGALRAVEAAGLSVPADVAVSGWDDIEGAAAAGLTTVDQRLHDQGARCAALALGRVGPSLSDRRFGWRLVLRASTREFGQA